MRFRRIAPAVVALALAAGACGDDATGPQIELTQQEIGELFAAIAEIFDGFANLSVANPGVSFSLVGVLEDIDETVSCPQGGSATAQGTANETETTFDLDVDLGFNECGSQGFVLGGSLNFDGSGSASDTEVHLDLSISGDLSVKTDSRSGTCTMSLDYSIDATQSGFDYSVSGSICGQNFNQST